MTDFGKLVARIGKAGGGTGLSAVSPAGNYGKVWWIFVFTLLVLSTLALWLSFNAAGRLAEVEQELARLSQKVDAVQTRGSDGPLRAEIHELGVRVNDLAVIIEGPFSHLRQSNEESLLGLSQRLERLEGEMAVKNGAVLTKMVAPEDVDMPPAEAGERGWVINLISLSSEQDAKQQMLRLRKAGVRVEMQQARHDGKSWYRLRVPGFSSYEGARAYITTVEKQAGVENAWVAKE